MILYVVGSFRLGEQCGPSAHCPSPQPEAEQRQGFLCSPWVLASHVWPPGFAFLHSASPQWALVWAKQVLGTASEKQIQMSLSWTASQPSQVKQQGEQREEMGEPFPKDWGWTLSLQRALVGSEEAGLSGEARPRSAQAGGYYLGSCIFISFLPVRFLELQNIHEVREAWKVMVRLSWIHPKSHIEIG